MPSGSNPNSRANLKLSKATQFKPGNTVSKDNRVKIAETKRKNGELRAAINRYLKADWIKPNGEKWIDPNGSGESSGAYAVAYSTLYSAIVERNPKAQALVMEMSGQTPAKDMNVNLETPDSEAGKAMLKELKKYAKRRSRKNTV